MAGVKGRSGRRTTSVEDKRKAVIDKAWQVCFDILNDPNASLAMKVDIAKSIVTKNMPQQLEHSGNLTWEGLVIDITGQEKRNLPEVSRITHN